MVGIGVGIFPFSITMLGGGAPEGDISGEGLLLKSTCWLSSAGVVSEEVDFLNPPELDGWGLAQVQTLSPAVVDGVSCFGVTATAGTDIHLLRNFTTVPATGQQCDFEILAHAGTETSMCIVTYQGALQSGAQIDLLTGGASYIGGGSHITAVVVSAEAGGWFRIKYSWNRYSGSSEQIRIYLRSIYSFAAAGTESIYLADPTATIHSAVSASAPNGSIWNQPTESLRPWYHRGVGGVYGVGGSGVNVASYLSSPAVLDGEEVSAAWVGHVGYWRMRHSAISGHPVTVARAVADSGDLMEVFLTSDGTAAHWGVRSTISGSAVECILDSRGASWATACVGFTVSGGILTWYVDGVEIAGGSLPVPEGISTMQVGQWSAGSTSATAYKWDNVFTDFAVWGYALPRVRHESIAREMLSRAGIPWGPWTVIGVSGQSNANTAGSVSGVLSYRGTVEQSMVPYMWSEATSGSANAGGLGFSPARRRQDTTGDVFASAFNAANMSWGLSYAMAVVLAGNKVALVGSGANGCPVAPGSYSWDPASGNVFDTQTDWHLSALAQVTGAYTQKMVWIHGEADCVGGGVAEAYESNMDAFVSAWESKCGSVDSWIFTRISTSQTALSATYAPTIRAAQEALGARYGRWVDTDGVPVNVDFIHFTPAGKMEIAERIGLV